MKRFCFALACIMVSLLISGCIGNSQSQALNTLSTQLANIEEIVGSTSSNEVNSVSPNVNFDASPKGLQFYKATAFNNMEREESIRQDILSLNTYLQSQIDQKVSLSDKQSQAIISISSNIKAYLDKIDQTKSDISLSVKKVEQHTDDKEVNIECTQSSYLTLCNYMNDRYVYMCNIYNNLQEIYYLLDCQSCCDDCPSNPTPDMIDEQNFSERTKNIDTFQSQNNTPSEPLPGVNNTPYQYNVPYNNGYNGYYRGRFNPNRNTDTFYPRLRNIDTYRYVPNYNYNNTNIPYTI